MDPERHADRRNWVESILRYIPGFRGYLEKEYRRESDYLARQWLANQLAGIKRPLDDYFRSQLDAGQIDALPLLDRIRTRLDGLISRIRGDVRGYSGFFDYVRVDERVLDQVYDHDMALVQQVQQVVKLVQNLPSSDGTAQQVSSELLANLDQVERQYRGRTDILKGLSEGP
jgi:hypothetical protein